MTFPLIRFAACAFLLLQIPNSLAAQAASSKPKATASQAPQKPAEAWMAPRTRGKLKPVDINKATLEEIGFMLGIDRDLAAKIVAGRPYLTKTRLYTKKVLTKEQYLALKDRVVVK